MLNHENLPFKKEQKIAYSLMTKFLNLETPLGRLNFLLCIVLLLFVLASTNYSSYYILIRNLIRAVNEGKIFQETARVISRRFKIKGINSDPELLEITAF